MKVVCKIDNLHSVEDSSVFARLKRYISDSNGVLDLQVGREYVVYGVEFWDNCPWFYLCTEDDDEYPKPFAADFFETTDKRISKCWTLVTSPCEGDENSTRLVFEEWARDSAFYERLIDGEGDAVTLFAEYRFLMDSE
ncbi:hypothetical protein [Pseudomonas sp. 6D_7.1_Bac1]|uniref:hypothetical protein n=1 Tax=Pseudomonas sp. 6D_7.1_Bac1 TaxID=2971615 RepID=UPI0021C6718F|nr:hypothetical protein [Pseudomonas sp. 6D_7.1_Bac1]MCU1748386.1 hypothetical protein [Pseudomonas sp. 6D_7.1_Bac1]